MQSWNMFHLCSDVSYCISLRRLLVKSNTTGFMVVDEYANTQVPYNGQSHNRMYWARTCKLEPISLTTVFSQLLSYSEGGSTGFCTTLCGLHSTHKWKSSLDTHVTHPSILKLLIKIIVSCLIKNLSFRNWPLTFL